MGINGSFEHADLKCSDRRTHQDESDQLLRTALIAGPIESKSKQRSLRRSLATVRPEINPLMKRFCAAEFDSQIISRTRRLSLSLRQDPGMSGGQVGHVGHAVGSQEVGGGNKALLLGVHGEMLLGWVKR
ncbi:hypothetical protein CEXT_787731 [Caerostris extrusa]|uniref:Uncharacterized protein n=1 Tax=Caerostris extrusa TaxID=172846 RepID=A0AAV4NTE6_CAEEX|nr:hypothetical protein CEXT_787731 [Caerostris extrusa]